MALKKKRQGVVAVETEERMTATKDFRPRDKVLICGDPKVLGRERLALAGKPGTVRYVNGGVNVGVETSSGIHQLPAHALSKITA